MAPKSNHIRWPAASRDLVRALYVLGFSQREIAQRLKEVMGFETNKNAVAGQLNKMRRKDGLVRPEGVGQPSFFRRRKHKPMNDKHGVG